MRSRNSESIHTATRRWGYSWLKSLQRDHKWAVQEPMLARSRRRKTPSWLSKVDRSRNAYTESWCFSSRQLREYPDCELSEVGDIDHTVTVEIECGVVIAGIEYCLREQSEVGDIHVPVAVDIAE